MPQASDELREYVRLLFAAERIVDDYECVQYLEARDWVLKKDWNWEAPYKNLNDIPEQEWEVYSYLIHEWDYGTIINIPQ